MRTTLLLLLIATIIIAACAKKSEYTYMARGLVLGPDTCSSTCCGGFIIQIDGRPESFRADSQYNDMSGDPVFKHITRFPQRISFDFQPYDTCGQNIFIMMKNWETMSRR